MKNERLRLPPDSLETAERWEIEWDHGSSVYGCYPYHRSFAAAVREVMKAGASKDGYGGRLESVTIKRIKVVKGDS